jgi:hypothetical protein
MQAIDVLTSPSLIHKLVALLAPLVFPLFFTGAYCSTTDECLRRESYVTSLLVTIFWCVLAFLLSVWLRCMGETCIVAQHYVIQNRLELSVFWTFIGQIFLSVSSLLHFGFDAWRCCGGSGARALDEACKWCGIAGMTSILLSFILDISIISPNAFEEQELSSHAEA